MKKNSLGLAAAVAASLVLAACGGGGDSPVLVATADTTLAISPANGAQVIQAVASKPLSFPSGVPALGTTGPTTVTIAPPATGTGTPTFSIAAGGGTATGDLAFGSCIFKIKESTIDGLPAGGTITVSPCAMKFDTSGKAASTVPVNTEIELWLGSTPSDGTQSQVIITETGELQVQGYSLSGPVWYGIGTISLQPVTG